jgi:hypothetical protein
MSRRTTNGIDMDDDLPSPADGSNMVGMHRRFLDPQTPRDKANVAPPTHDYWYGTNGRRWGGRGRKNPHRSWKKKRKTQYAPIPAVGGEP